jgi:predicted nucleic-acid-binding protein
MNAIDTNVFVRLFVKDDRLMAAAVEKLMRQPPVFVPKTVLLESVWVLSSRFGMPRTEIHDMLEQALANPDIEFEDGHAVIDALEAARGGMDLEDALHLFSSRNCDAFATFDRDIGKLASRQSVKIRILDPMKQGK